MVKFHGSSVRQSRRQLWVWYLHNQHTGSTWGRVKSPPECPGAKVHHHFPSRKPWEGGKGCMADPRCIYRCPGRKRFQILETPTQPKNDFWTCSVEQGQWAQYLRKMDMK